MLLTVITVVIGVVLALLVYYWIRRMVLRRATAIVTNDARAVTEQAMAVALEKLIADQILAGELTSSVPAQTIADVWGRGVMAFEFTLPADMITATDLPTVRRPLNNALAAYAEDQHVKRLTTDQPAFIVTDLWIFENRAHIDIAYLMNESTVEYVQDLRRLSSSDNSNERKKRESETKVGK